MYVIKRDGSRQTVLFDKITTRLKRLCEQAPSLAAEVDPTLITQKVGQALISGITTTELDNFAAEIAAYLTTQHPQYGVLAGRIAVSNLHKETDESFLNVVTSQYNYKVGKEQVDAPTVSEKLYKIVCNHHEVIQRNIDYSLDYSYDFFGFKTLEKSYLVRLNNKIVERPQHMLMRVALEIHGENLKKAFKTYRKLSKGYFIHATPTLFTAGTPKPQMSSCFLLTMKEDSIEGIYETLKWCALISKSAGGIGVSVSNIRASRSYIKGTNGFSNGLVPMLRVFNDTARYVDQCFVPDTYVYAPDCPMGAKTIETLKVGDLIKTHTGESRHVERVLAHDVVNEKLWNITTESGTTRVTAAHQYLVLQVPKDNDNRNLLSSEEMIGRIEAGFSKAEMIDVDQIRAGDYVCFPKGTNELQPMVPKIGEKHFMHNDVLYVMVISTKIEDELYTGKLYDLEVADHHTYVIASTGIVKNGGGKRKGAFAIYLEPWHADVEDFLQLKKNHGKEEQRARDLFYGLWIPDLFMKRVEQNGDWSLFCPAEAPGLFNCWGEQFEELYERYEREGRARKTMKAQDLWFQIVDSQIETGNPYMLYKDACNRKSNQQNLGTIKSSNLCTEIIEYTSEDEVAVCNLASIALPKYVSHDGTSFNHKKLFKIVYMVTENLNSIIDNNYYPLPETRTSNMRHRPIGIGVQGLADVFLKMRYPYESRHAGKLNKDIFETIYFAALTCSKDLAIKYGTYETYAGSPVSKGQLQFDMWGVTPDSGLWDWNALKAEIAQHGLRNSLLVAPMPTASTSQILSNNESVEAYTTNVYTRRVLCGEFVVINKHLVKDLLRLGLWTNDIKNELAARNGSVQDIDAIPSDIKELYKTAWEIKMRKMIDMAADRGAYIDQSQSFNAFMAKPTREKLTSMHFYSWKRGLKTGMYYLRTRPAVDAIKFTVDLKKLKEKNEHAEQTEPIASPSIDKSQLLNPTPKMPSASNVLVDSIDGEICRMEEGCLNCGS